jgi:cell division control protein 45
MYLPRTIISHLYTQLQRSRHPLSPPVLILVALDPDALCACRILTQLFKNDFIPHNIKPISGYADLTRAGEELVRPMRKTEGGGGGLVVCLGVGGLVDLESLLGLEVDEDGNGGMGGVDVWVFDARRPWNLSNVFGIQNHVSSESDAPRKSVGVDHGKILPHYRPGEGGIIVFDDGDIDEELGAEKEAYCSLAEMPELDEDDVDLDSDDSDAGSDVAGNEDADGIPESAQPRAGDVSDSDEGSAGQKRKRRQSPQFSDDEHSDPDEGTPNKRRRSNSSSPIASPSRPGARSLLILSTDRATSQSATAGTSKSKEVSARTLQKQLLKLKRKHDAVLQKYYNLGQSYSEPISSLMWNLASDLGRDENDLLWHAIVGVSSFQISGKTSSGIGLSPVSTSGSSSSWNKDRGERIRAIFRDEVRRLNPVDLKDLAREAGDSAIIPTHANSPTDMSIRLSPEPRFMLVRHWSLKDSMMHSPYLSAKLHIWSDSGRRKLNKLLAKMGISQKQCNQSYTHMDMELKKGLRQKLLQFAPLYGLEGLIPPETRHNSREGWGFVRCWGWKACLSAIDAGVVIGAILEVGDMESRTRQVETRIPTHTSQSGTNTPANNTSQVLQGAVPTPQDKDMSREDSMLKRFWTAYDALGDISLLTTNISTAQHLHRAILRTGTSLIEKRQIRHLRAFRMTVVKEGPDVQLFTHPGALTKLALWLAEAISEMDGLKGHKSGELVMAGLDEEREVYVVVGLGGGSAVQAQKVKDAKRAEKKKEKEAKKNEKKAEKEKKKRLRKERLAALGADSDIEDDDETESEASDSDSDSSDDDEDEKPEQGKGFNRFGNAFQEVIEETGARVKVDSFEHCVVEVRKDDLQAFLECLCLKTVVG